MRSHTCYILVNSIELTNILTMFTKSKVNTPYSLSIASMIMLFNISRFTYLYFLAFSIFISNGGTTLLTYRSPYNLFSSANFSVKCSMSMIVPRFLRFSDIFWSSSDGVIVILYLFYHLFL